MTTQAQAEFARRGALGHARLPKHRAGNSTIFLVGVVESDDPNMLAYALQSGFGLFVQLVPGAKWLYLWSCHADLLRRAQALIANIRDQERTENPPFPCPAATAEYVAMPVSGTTSAKALLDKFVAEAQQVFADEERTRQEPQPETRVAVGTNVAPPPPTPPTSTTPGNVQATASVTVNISVPPGSQVLTERVVSTTPAAPPPPAAAAPVPTPVQPQPTRPAIGTSRPPQREERQPDRRPEPRRPEPPPAPMRRGASFVAPEEDEEDEAAVEQPVRAAPPPPRPAPPPLPRRQVVEAAPATTPAPTPPPVSGLPPATRYQSKDGRAMLLCRCGASFPVGNSGAMADHRALGHEKCALCKGYVTDENRGTHAADSHAFCQLCGEVVSPPEALVEHRASACKGA